MTTPPTYDDRIAELKKEYAEWSERPGLSGGPELIESAIALASELAEKLRVEKIHGSEMFVKCMELAETKRDLEQERGRRESAEQVLQKIRAGVHSERTVGQFFAHVVNTLEEHSSPPPPVPPVAAEEPERLLGTVAFDFPGRPPVAAEEPGAEESLRDELAAASGPCAGCSGMYLEGSEVTVIGDARAVMHRDCARKGTGRKATTGEK